MPYGTQQKRNEYQKLLMRRRRNSKLALPGKSLVEQMKENLRNRELESV